MSIMSLQSKPEFDDWTSWLKGLIEWQNFATFLPEIKREHIRKIESENASVEKRKAALYDKWLEIYSNAIWQDAITALKRAELNALAEEIHKKLTCTCAETQITVSSFYDQGKTSSDADSTFCLPQASQLEIVTACNSGKEKIEKEDVKHRPIGRRKKFYPTPGLSKQQQENQEMFSCDTRNSPAQKVNEYQYEENTNSKQRDYSNVETDQLDIQRQTYPPMPNSSSQFQELMITPNDPDLVEKLKSLYSEFINLVENIKRALIKLIENGTYTLIDIASYLGEYFRVEGLTSATDIHALFQGLWPHYSYLNCEVLEVITKNKDFHIQEKLQKDMCSYKQQLEQFKTSTTLNEFKNAVEPFIPNPEVTAATCKVVIKLNRPWGKKTLENFETLVNHMFRQRMSHVRVEEGSICVTLLVPRSKVDYISKLGNVKKDFASLIGIFELTVNDEHILKKTEKEKFSFHQALEKASQFDNDEAVKFLTYVINYEKKEFHLQKNGHSSKWFSINAEASLHQVLIPGFKGDHKTTSEIGIFTTCSSISQDADVHQSKVVEINFVCAEDEEFVQTTLESLSRDFTKLMLKVQSALDDKLQQQQLKLVDITRWIEHQMLRVGELSNIEDSKELFMKIQISQYFNFLECGLIVDISEEFIKEDKILVSAAREYMDKVKVFCCSRIVKQVQNKLKTIYKKHRGDLSNMPNTYFELHNLWRESTKEKLYVLIGQLLPHRSKQLILKKIEIDRICNES